MPPCLRFAPETRLRLTKPNTSRTIGKPASLRSDQRSTSSRNRVQLPPGLAFSFPGIRRRKRFSLACSPETGATVLSKNVRDQSCKTGSVAPGLHNRCSHIGRARISNLAPIFVMRCARTGHDQLVELPAMANVSEDGDEQADFVRSKWFHRV